MSDSHLYSSRSRQGVYPLAGARLAGFCFVLLLALVFTAQVSAGAPERAAAVGPAGAEAATVQALPVFAFLGSENWAKYLTTRTNIVRFCVCVMALALFIMIKK